MQTPAQEYLYDLIKYVLGEASKYVKRAKDVDRKAWAEKLVYELINAERQAVGGACIINKVFSSDELSPELTAQELKNTPKWMHRIGAAIAADKRARYEEKQKEGGGP